MPGIGVGMLEEIVMMMVPTEGIKGKESVVRSDCKKVQKEQPCGENLDM